MGIRIVRLGSPRRSGEGIRFGTVRRPPRGVKKTEYASRDFYDLWLPDLAPSAELVSWAQSRPLTDAQWKTFARKYRREMNAPVLVYVSTSPLAARAHPAAVHSPVIVRKMNS